MRHMRGAIGSSNNLFPVCDCPGDNKHLVLKAKRGGKRKSGVTICAACGRMNSAGLVWRFAVGSEAAASVLATSVYHSLKSSKPSGISDEVAVAAENKTGASCLLFR